MATQQSLAQSQQQANFAGKIYLLLVLCKETVGESMQATVSHTVHLDSGTLNKNGD